MNRQNKNISLILIVKNEAENLKQNFNWLKDFPIINEIVVVDDNSTDNTKNILKNYETEDLKIHIFQKDLNKDFSEQRNFAVSKTKNEWILWLDADEIPSKELLKFIKKISLNQGNDFSFKRNDVFLNKELKHGETANQYFIRLFNKNFGNFQGQVHEKWVSTRNIEKVEMPIFHISHPNLKSFLEKINLYTDIRAEELYKKNVKTNTFTIIIYPLGKFIQNYFIRLGFLDATPGIIMALSMSFHSFLVRAKLWHLYQK